MKRTIIVLAGVLLLGLILGCGYVCRDKFSTNFVYTLTPPQYVFGFDGQQRYAYCPSIIDNGDGSTHIYFCGTKSGIFVDNIYHLQELPDDVQTSAKSVLQPSLDWDRRHDCDPSVVEGRFVMGGVTYRYAMFFLSNPMEFLYNEIGVAFSNDLAADSWVKYPRQVVVKPWDESGDQLHNNGRKSWGVGQPSAISLDKKGRVLLTYTQGDIDGTRLLWRELDMSDMDNLVVGPPNEIVSEGWLKRDGESLDYGANSDFAVNIDLDKIVMVRPVHPFDKEYPSYIASAIEVLWMPFSDFMQGKGAWRMMYRIGAADTGFKRNHNAGIMRDSFGHIEDWDMPVVYFTVSKITPDVEPTPENHAEWTYTIYKTRLKKESISPF